MLVMSETVTLLCDCDCVSVNECRAMGLLPGHGCLLWGRAPVSPCMTKYMCVGESPVLVWVTPLFWLGCVVAVRLGVSTSCDIFSVCLCAQRSECRYL